MLIKTCHVYCADYNIFTTFKMQVVLHSFIRAIINQNVGLFIVPIIGIRYILANVKNILPLPGMFCIQ